MSLDGQWVANLNCDDDLAGDTNGQCDVYLTEAGTGPTTIASIATGGALSDGSSCRSEGPSRSANGDCISFLSRGTNLVAGDTNDTEHIFIRTNGPTG